MACPPRPSEDNEKTPELPMKCPDEDDSVSLNLRGSLAKKWHEEKGSSDDISFMKLLLDMYSQCKEQFPTHVNDKMPVVDAVFSVNESVTNRMFLPTPKSSEIIKQNIQVSAIEEEELTETIPVQVEIEQTDLKMKEKPEHASSNAFVDSMIDDNLESDLVEILVNKSDVTTCEICQQKVIGETKRHHIFSEHFSLYVNCKLCDVGEVSDNAEVNLIDVDEYLSHQATAHRDLSRQCLFCKQKITLNTFSRHLINMHWKQLYCLCDTCGVNHGSNTPICILKGISVGGHVLKRHSSYNQEKTACEICGIIVQQLNLAKHIKSVHKGSREICELCGKSFNDVARHKKRIHVTSPCKYECTICDKKLATKWNLAVHKRLHTGEKPFICEVCGKSYHQKIELKLHTQKHHENPHRKQDNRKVKTVRISKPNTNRKSMVSNNTKIIPEVSLPVSHADVLQTMLSTSKLPGNTSLYTVIPSQPCPSALLSNTSNNSSNVQSITVIDVRDKDLSNPRLVWIAQAGEGVAVDASSGAEN